MSRRLAVEPPARGGIYEMMDVWPDDPKDFYCGEPATHLHRPIANEPKYDMHVCADCARGLLTDPDFIVEPLKP